MIRVILVDDHLLMRQGTEALLAAAPEIAVVAQTARGEEALTLAREMLPDVLLLDIRLEGLNGIEVARILHQDLPAVKVLMLTAYAYDAYVRSLFAIGVQGYLLKSASGPELIEAVRAVYRGEEALSVEIVAQRAAGPDKSGIAAGGALSVRETEVLSLVRQGAANKEIATALRIKTRTVESYLSNAMAKLVAHSRTEAISTALQLGILPPD